MNHHPMRAALPPTMILWGGTGQAKVVRPIVEAQGTRVIAVFDDTPQLVPPFADVPLFHGAAGFAQWIAGRPAHEIGFCVAIGNPHGRVRLRLHDRLCTAGLRPVSVIHPASYIAANAHIGLGAQLMAGAMVLAEAQLGRQVIINTRASVDHECVIGDGAELAPGVTLCGCITLGTNAWVGAGATVLPRRHIGDDAIIGAGAVVTRDIPAGATALGVPARVRGGAS